MNQIRYFIVNLLTNNPEGLTHSEIHQKLIEAGLLGTDAQLPNSYYYLHNENNGLVIQGLVLQDIQFKPYRYFAVQVNDAVNDDATTEAVYQHVDHDIAKNGFDGLVARLKGNRGVNPAWTLIPSDGDACTPIVVAVADGFNNVNTSNWGELDRVMTIVKTHLIRCNKVRHVKVITDAWNPYFKLHHLDEVRAFSDARIIKFRFCLVNPNRRSTSVININR